MDLAMQYISNDKTVKNHTIQDLKEFNNSSKERGTISFNDTCY